MHQTSGHESSLAISVSCTLVLKGLYFESSTIRVSASGPPASGVFSRSMRVLISGVAFCCACSEPTATAIERIVIQQHRFHVPRKLLPSRYDPAMCNLVVLTVR
jgi:hypothetical protein